MTVRSRAASYFQKPEGAAWVFLLPSLLIFVVFVFLPLVATVGMGTLKLDIFLKAATFVGAENFARALTDERFWNALKNTLVFTAVEVPLQVGFALILALLVKQNTLFRKAARAILFVPVVCSMTAISILWSILLDPTLGFIPGLLKLAGFDGFDFLKSVDQAMPTVIAITVWKNFGMSMVILVAGLQSIPSSYYEAGQMDGAGSGQMFRSITLPVLAPSLGFCVITNIIGSLQVFDQVYVMTKGGPLFSTESVVEYIYNRGFRLPPYELGYASALAELLFVVIAAVSFLTFRYFQRVEGDLK